MRLGNETYIVSYDNYDNIFGSNNTHMKTYWVQATLLHIYILTQSNKSMIQIQYNMEMLPGVDWPWKCRLPATPDGCGDIIIG